MNEAVDNRQAVFNFIFEMINMKAKSNTEISEYIITSINQITNIDIMVIDTEIGKLKTLKAELQKLQKRCKPENKTKDLTKLASLHAQVDETLEQIKLVKEMLQQHDLIMLQKSLDCMVEHGIINDNFL